MYLLDTMVLSDFAKRRRNDGVVAWASSIPATQMFVSTVTIGEIEFGLTRQRELDPAFYRDMSAWLDAVIRVYGDRILALDTATARRWGQLGGRLGHKSFDLAIAATALEHGLTVVTRNTRHFLPAGVPTIDPFN